VVVSGRAGRAARLRAEATRLGIPVVQHVSLARALVNLEPGEEIPEDLYQATAGILRAIQA
jgi:flagellar biosynthetic protein FlhB